MRLPPILLRMPAGLPPLESFNDREGRVDSIPSIYCATGTGVSSLFAGAFFGIAEPETIQAMAVFLAIAAVLFATCARWAMQDYRDDAADVEHDVRGLLSGHQMILLERHGGIAALRRGFFLKRCLRPAVAAGCAALCFAAARIFVFLHAG